MFPAIERITPEFAKELCQEITTDLPEYFGLSEANERYFQGMLSRFSWGAKMGEKYVGLLTLEFPYSANIYWMGVKRAFQGQGTGSALIESAVACAQWKGLNTLTVETLSSVECDENYIKTWHFYLPQYRRQGIGSALLAMAEDAAARRKHQQVGIWCWTL